MEKLKPHSEEIKSNPESHNDSERERREEVVKILRLVEKINESGENLPFPGIRPDMYLRMKKNDEEFLGYATPIDEIIERCKKEGIKVVLGRYSESGSTFVLPVGSDDIEMDSIASYQLIIDTVKNEDLEELIRLTTKKGEA